MAALKKLLMALKRLMEQYGDGDELLTTFKNLRNISSIGVLGNTFGSTIKINGKNEYIISNMHYIINNFCLI